MSSIAFNQKALLPVVSDSKPFNVLYHVEENRWNNTVTTQLNIKDIEPADNSPLSGTSAPQDDYAYRTSSDKKDSRFA